MAMFSWTQRLALALARERQTHLLSAHLDLILLWLSHPENAQTFDLTQAFLKVGLTPEIAARRIYLQLDQLLFSGLPQAPTTLDLAPNALPQRVKHRYRRLMQVYHPDRHATKPLWATQRTERINLAFHAHRHGTHGWKSAPFNSKLSRIQLFYQRFQHLLQSIRNHWWQLIIGMSLFSLIFGITHYLIQKPPLSPLTIQTPQPAFECDSITSRLMQFQSAYHTGELNTLIKLYDLAAQENQFNTRAQIQLAYANWFQNTPTRRIQFTQIRSQPISHQRQCSVLAIYHVQYQNAQLQRTIRTGTVEFLFAQSGTDLLILRMNY